MCRVPETPSSIQGCLSPRRHRHLVWQPSTLRRARLLRDAEHTVLSTHLFNEENVLVGIDLNRLVLGLYHCYGLEARVVDLLSLAS
jgi:hypothetical protein